MWAWKIFSSKVPNWTKYDIFDSGRWRPQLTRYASCLYMAELSRDVSTFDCSIRSRFITAAILYVYEDHSIFSSLKDLSLNSSKVWKGGIHYQKLGLSLNTVYWWRRLTPAANSFSSQGRGRLDILLVRLKVLLPWNPAVITLTI